MSLRSRAIGAVILAVTVGCSGTPAASPSPTTAPTAQPTSAPTAPPTAAPTPTPPPTPAPTPTPGAQTLTFDDGALTIEIPAGALPQGVELDAIERGPEDRPPELADIEMRGTFYSIEPDGLTFAAPVRMTRRVPIVETGIDVAQLGMPIVSLALRTSDGTWEWLGNQSVMMDEEYLYVAGDATHTSVVIGFGGNHFARSTHTPPELRMLVGDSFTLDVELLGPITAPAPPQIYSGEPFTHTGVLAGEVEVFDSPNWANLPPLDRQSAMPRVRQPFECAQPGRFFTIVGYEVVTAPGNFFFEHLGLDSPTTTARFPLDVECLPNGPAIPGGDVPNPTAGCVVVVHTPLGTFVSYLRMLLVFGVELRRVEVTMSGANDGQPVIGERLGDNYFEILAGLRQAGTKELQSVIVTDAQGMVHDVTQGVIGFFGSSTLDVPFPGEPTFGSCPPPP